MANGYGFLTATPDARLGDGQSTISADLSAAGKHIAPGASGTITVTAIGAYVYGANSAARVHLAIFTDDSANGNPDSLVDNSDTGELTPATGDITKLEYTYTGTKPILNATQAYWLALQTNGTTTYLSRYTTDGVGCYRSGTYPTWPSAASWDSASDVTSRYSLYAIYEVPATAQFARPSSDVAGGTFRSIHTTAPFGPIVIA